MALPLPPRFRRPKHGPSNRYRKPKTQGNRSEATRPKQLPNGLARFTRGEGTRPRPMGIPERGGSQPPSGAIGAPSSRPNPKPLGIPNRAPSKQPAPAPAPMPTPRGLPVRSGPSPRAIQRANANASFKRTATTSGDRFTPKPEPQPARRFGKVNMPLLPKPSRRFGGKG